MEPEKSYNLRVKYNKKIFIQKFFNDFISIKSNRTNKVIKKPHNEKTV